MAEKSGQPFTWDEIRDHMNRRADIAREASAAGELYIFMCGCCTGQIWCKRPETRQHLQCRLCGAQMIQTIEADGTNLIRLICAGPPYLPKKG